MRARSRPPAPRRPGRTRDPRRRGRDRTSPRERAARTAGIAPGRAPGTDDASPELRARPPARLRRSSDPYRTRLRAPRTVGPARLSRKLAARPRPGGAPAPPGPPAGGAALQRDRAREARKPARPD